jgi:small conductance mechanosensitive channel
MPDLTESPWAEIVRFVQSDLLPILLTIIVAAIALRVADGFIRGVIKTVMDREAAEGTSQELSAAEVQKRMDTLAGLASKLVRVFIIVIGGLMILGTLGLDIGPAVAGLGVVGIAVGFGAQSLVRDYLNGALILIENQFAKGDVVSLAGVSGTVEDFSLRRTTLRDLDGVVHTVPNGEIQVASNQTRGWARINEDVSVAYGTDFDAAAVVVDAVGAAMAADDEWKRRILEAPRVVRVETLGESGITLKVLGSVRAGDQWAARGEFRKRLLVALAANDIEIPYPHRVIVNRVEGPAATAAAAADATAADAGAAAGTDDPDT